MIIDGLCFVGTSRFGYQLSVDAALRGLDAQGISAAVVAPMHPRDGDFATANVELARIARDSADRLVWIARVDPWDGELALEQLTHAVANDGARGLFLHPAEEHFRINDMRLRPIAERANELGVPIMVATGFHCMSEAAQVARFAQWCPDTAVIMTNGGQLNISGLGQFDAELALRLDNVHIQTSGVYRDDFLERTVKSFGAERVLFASFAPVFDTRYERQRVEKVHLTDAERQLLLSGNTQRLFGFPGGA
jgi:predicted TIM-barrel fold metal-dependent hydrolase